MLDEEEEVNGGVLAVVDGDKRRTTAAEVTNRTIMSVSVRQALDQSKQENWVIS